MLSVVSAHSVAGLTDIYYTKDGRFVSFDASISSLQMEYLVIFSLVDKMEIFMYSIQKLIKSSIFVVLINVFV